MKKIYKIKNSTKCNLNDFINYYNKKLMKLHPNKAKIIRGEMIIAEKLLNYIPVSVQEYQKMITRLKKTRDDKNAESMYYRSLL